MANRGGFGGGGNFSHKAPMLSTDLRCYFQCNQGFKKDYDLRLHLKIRHKHEDEEELRRAYQDAEEEIALVKRSLSTYECALCQKKYNEAGPFYDHIKKVHNMQWLDFKDKYGRCETEMGSFECKICGRVVKYDRECIHSHLKKVHNINWGEYVDRIRKMRQGERPKELPSIELFQCKICNSTVKFDFRKKHLQGIHKITETEYVELFSEGEENNNVPGTSIKTNFDDNAGYKSMEVQQNYRQDIPLTDYQDQLPLTDNVDLSFEEGRVNQSNIDSGFDNANGLGNDTQPYYGANNSSINSPTEILGPPKPSKLDIQDKTNTSCSSCNLEFDYRRIFIEHCTTVHNMKFRTKSGAMISSTTIQQKNIQPNFGV